MTRPLCLLLLLAAGAALAGPQTNLVPNGDFSRGLADWTGVEEARAKLVDGAAGPFRRYLSTQAARGETAWATSLRYPLEAPVNQGERLQLVFWARSAGLARINVKVERNAAPHDGPISQQLKLTADWQRYELSGAAAASFQAAQLQLVIHLAQDGGAIDLAGFTLMNLDDKTPDLGPAPTVDQPLAMIENGDFSAGLAGWTGVGAALPGTLAQATVDGRPRAILRLTLQPPANAQPWSLGLGRACTGWAARNDAIWFRAWLRSPDRCRVSFIFEETGPPNQKDISHQVTLTPEWREYRFAGRARRAYRPGDATAKFFLGHSAGTVEVADIRVENLGAAPGHQFDETIDYWGGRPHDDSWRAAALARIEQIRKGDLTIKVVDAAGRPVPGAQVKVTQQRHHFRFGTAAPAARFIDSTNPDNVRFQQEAARLFNTVTFENDLKWAASSEAGLARVDAAIKWLRERDLEVRGHCLVWGSYEHLVRAARELRGDALRQAVRDHVRDYAKRFDGQVYLWDVVNEAGSNVEVWNETGWDLFPEVFKLAREASPKTRLAYNDYSMTVESNAYRDKVAARVKQLLDGGAPFEVIGLQEHHGLPLTPLPTILKWLDWWGEFGKDLEITEYDLACREDTVHGQWSRDHLIACFSHPKVVSYIMWGFWAGSHWKGADGGAMFNRDWSKRPACLAWEDLVLNQWWTRWTGPATDGNATLRAFYGRHQVAVTAGDKAAEATVELRPGGPGEVTVKLP